MGNGQVVIGMWEWALGNEQWAGGYGHVGDGHWAGVYGQEAKEGEMCIGYCGACMGNRLRVASEACNVKLGMIDLCMIHGQRACEELLE